MAICSDCNRETYVKYKSTEQCQDCYLKSYLPEYNKEYFEQPGNKDKRKRRRRKNDRKLAGFNNPTDETKDGNCDSCGRFQAPLYLDHCHNTGITRGWLCSRCNSALGFAKDSPKILLNLIEYIYQYHPELRLLYK